MLAIEELPLDLKSVATYRELAKNQILFQQGEVAEAIFWVESGRVKLVQFTEQQMITYYSASTGESFAEGALYFDTYACTAIAEQPSRVMAIPKQAFLDALHQSPALSEKYLAHLTHRFSAVKQLLELRSMRSARDRLLRYLTYRLQPGESTVPLVGSLKALATDLGISPEVLYRTLARLEAENILSRKKGSITFSDEWLDA